MKPVAVAILGATGYGAGELLRLFTQHPHVDVVSLTTTSQAGTPVADIHPHLAGFYDGLSFAGALDYDALLAAEQAIVISAVPHGASSAMLDNVLKDVAARGAAERVGVIDLSGDLRLQDAALHQQFYPKSPLFPERRTQFVYGLPELAREPIRGARCVANPGCLASGAILAAAPLAGDEFVGPLVFDTKTGSSGSGRQLKEGAHHPMRHGDFRAYKPLAHQHEPEVRQALGDVSGTHLQTSFVAQSLDVARGIYVTFHATLTRDTTAAELAQRYADYYAGSPFIRMRPEPPRLQDVVGANFCDIAVAARGRQILVMAALDNLVKGMSGVAIQNLNLMCGFPETTGLWAPSFRPV